MAFVKISPKDIRQRQFKKGFTGYDPEEVGSYMKAVAAEMEREGFDIPLMIGGATTSRVHTAVKIHPAYNAGQAVYVTDASRAVGVVSTLLSAESNDNYTAGIKAEYEKVAAAHARAEADKLRLPIEKARENAMKLETPGASTYAW